MEEDQDSVELMFYHAWMGLGKKMLSETNFFELVLHVGGNKFFTAVIQSEKTKKDSRFL